MENELIIVEWGLDDIFGELKRISLVSEPAIESDFMLFNSPEMKFKAIDESKRVLTGPAMRPNIKIKRYNELGELYYGYFTEDVVRQAAELFFKKGSNTNKTNLEHEFEIDGVYVFESWLVENPEMDKSKELGFVDVKKGDWFVSMKVENDVVWNNYLKTGLIKGFSVEIRTEEKEIETIEMISAVLDSNWSEDMKFQSIKKLIEVIAKPYVDETGKIKKEPVLGLKEGVPHYTADGKLWTGPTHKDASGRLMTGATHTEDSEYLYHEDELLKFESYNDYPEAAKRNAQIALDWAEKNGWGSCGTPVGKQRANQLAKGEGISEDTISRMAAFERHRQNSQKELGDGCGRLMWQAWGGDEGIEWAKRKLEQIRK
ncbi:hypothetical protein EBU94_00795 [bacterium]|nr:hypothetical protein [bacterium]